MKDYLPIKNELIKRVEQKFKSINKPAKRNVGFEGLVEMLETKFDEKNLKKIEDLINTTLNGILKEGKIEFKGDEKDKFIEYIKPAVTELIVKFINN
jgi:hypothetical protein